MKSISSRSVLLILLALLMILSLCACAQKPSDEENTGTQDPFDVFVQDNPALAKWVAYATQSLVSTRVAYQDHCHYETQEAYDAATERDNAYSSFRVKQFIQITDSLWVIEFTIKHPGWTLLPDGVDSFHFVGIIEGEYYVMIGQDNIPANLKEGLDLSPYYVDPGKYL